MKTTLFLSVSIDGLIANDDGIPMFPEHAWPDWCALVNETGNVIAGRSSVEQLKDDPMGEALHPEHRIVLSSRDLDFTDAGWQAAKTPEAALEILRVAGVEEALIGGGRAVAHAFMQAGLVDEIVIDLQPMAFGSGVPVFGDALPPTPLKLVSSEALNDDAIRLRYQVLR